MFGLTTGEYSSIEQYCTAIILVHVTMRFFLSLW